MTQVNRTVAIMWLIFTVLFLGMAAWHWYLSGQLASDLNMSHLQNMLAAGGYFLAALTSLISFFITVHEQKRHIVKNGQATKHLD
jgi:hypothetical protein